MNENQHFTVTCGLYDTKLFIFLVFFKQQITDIRLSVLIGGFLNSKKRVWAFWPTAEAHSDIYHCKDLVR